MIGRPGPPGPRGPAGAAGAAGSNGAAGAAGADGLDVGGFQTTEGLIVPQSVAGIQGIAAGTWTSNQGKFVQFTPKANIAISRFAIIMTTNDPADVDLSAAIYSADLATRHHFLTTTTGWSTATVAGGGNRIVFTFGSGAGTVLTKGTRYWFGLAIEGTTVALIRHGLLAIDNLAIVGANLTSARGFTMAGCMPMPAGGSVVPSYSTSGTLPYAALLTA